MATISFKQFIGVEEFKELPQIIEFLKNEDSSQDFSNSSHQLFESNKDFRLWIITSATGIFIVRDDGFKLKTILKRNKNDFEFSIVKDNNKPRLFIKNTITTLPINTSLTGSAETFKNSLSEISK